MGLIVVEAGPGSTVQDRGRPGYARFGVPRGGAFDRDALDLANALLGNDPDAAAIELTLYGGSFRAAAPLALAVAGTSLAAWAGGRGPLAVPGSFAIGPGEVLRLGGMPTGARAYLAVRGGFRTAEVLGSRSSEVRLGAGDILPAEAGWTPSRRPGPAPDRIDPGGSIRIVNGPDARPGSDAGALEAAGPFRVGPAHDRVGLRLDGPAIGGGGDPSRWSGPVAPGAIQVAGGRLIVLGVAGGTTGGYPHAAHVISADLGRLGQLRAGDPVLFRRVEVAEARRIDRDRRRRLDARLGTIRAIAADLGGFALRPGGVD